jgi:hypothetical protein
MSDNAPQITPEWRTQVSAICQELGISAAEHASYADRIGAEDRFRVFAAWSPALTPTAEVKDAVAAMRAQAMSAELEAERRKTPHISADGQKICGLDKALWERLSPSNRIQFFREWQNSQGITQQTNKQKRAPANPDNTLRRLESELRAAEMLAAGGSTPARRSEHQARAQELRQRIAEHRKANPQ